MAAQRVGLAQGRTRLQCEQEGEKRGARDVPRQRRAEERGGKNEREREREREESRSIFAGRVLSVSPSLSKPPALRHCRCSAARVALLKCSAPPPAKRRRERERERPRGLEADDVTHWTLTCHHQRTIRNPFLCRVSLPSLRLGFLIEAEWTRPSAFLSQTGQTMQAKAVISSSTA